MSNPPKGAPERANLTFYESINVEHRIGCDVHSANKKIPKRIKRLGIYLLLKHEPYGRSSDCRINLILAPSRPVKMPSQKLEITYRNKSVARCEFRSRSQRRVRTGV